MTAFKPAYRADIDGLRALAVGLVIGFHYFPNFIKSGFIGVDIFFVISGYLITAIIIRQIKGGRWSYAHFYTRRINRIFPALLIVLVLNILLGWYSLVPNEFSILGKHIASSAAFILNLTLWNEAGYFDSAADTKPLLHLWSLAIEEQFYIVWPIVVAFAVRNRFLLIVGSITIASLLYSAYASVHSPAAAYYSLFSRFFELSIGGILAYLHCRDVGLRQGQNVVSLLGVTLIAAGAVFITPHSIFPGFNALLPVLGTALLIFAGSSSFINRRLLAFRPLVWVGLISYPLYLWHWTLLVWTKTLLMTDVISAKVRIGLVGLSLTLAALTYLLAEKPIRKRNTGQLAIALTSGMAAVGIFGLLAWGGIIPNRLNDKELEPIVAAVNDWEYPGNGMVVQTAFVDYTFYRKNGLTEDMVLFVGDSTAEQYAPRVSYLIESSATEQGAIFATKGGCPFASPELASRRRDCASKIEEIQRLAQSEKVRSIVIVQEWRGLSSMLVDPGAAASFQMFLRSIPNEIRKFVVLSTPSGTGFGPADLLEGSRLSELNYHASEYRNAARQLSSIAPLNQLIRAIAEGEGATVIDPTDTLCNGDQCRVTGPDGRPAYRDRSHLSASFVRNHAAYIDQTLVRETPSAPETLQ